MGSIVETAIYNDQTECFWCEKLFFYSTEEMRYNQDENSNGEIIDWYEVLCPYCEEITRI